LTAFIVFVLYSIWKKWRSMPRNLPVLTDGGLFGTTRAIMKVIAAAMRKEHLHCFNSVHMRLGDTFTAKIPSQPWWVVTRCPKNVEYVLSKNFSNYPKGSFFTGRLADLLGSGIFNADGDTWFHQRKTSSQMFTAKLFKEHIWLVVQKNTRILRDALRDSPRDEPVDIFNFMNRFTLDTIGEIGFGRSIGSLSDPSSPFLRSFDKAQQIAFRRFFLPHWPLLKFFGMGSERETREHFDLLDEYSREVVRDLQSNIDKQGDEAVSKGDIEARRSFVGLFIAEAKKRKESHSEDFLRDAVLNFLIAGRDTTAQALSWTIYLLSSHPEAMAKARQEVMDVCGASGPSYDEINKLPYLQAVISESLRLFPSVPVDIKVAIQDDTLPDGTFVPRGTVLLYNIFSMARNTSIWGTDCEKFRPERWLEMDASPSNYVYPVFNAGPRECLGKRLAQVEMRACLASLLPHFTFELAIPSDQITPDGQLTIGMANGLPCYVKSIGQISDEHPSAVI